MGLAYLLHQFAPSIQAESADIFQEKVEGNFYSKYCQFLYARDENLFASFSWQHLSRRYPMALFVPGDDYMAEWRRVGPEAWEGDLEQVAEATATRLHTDYDDDRLKLLIANKGFDPRAEGSSG